ncbi:uncharacterized protein [Amphiura filiformis]|uniref:uncharacterized protein n=1 Tax=Amphiura filiformis TaxID=82378 RepID=UPI003B226FE6
MIMDSPKTILLFGICLCDLSLELVVKALDITDIRLLGSPTNTPNAGRVQVYDTDQWKDVCHDGDDRGDKDWSFKEAMVACRQLGYPGTAMKRKGGYGNGNSNNAIDAFECDGDELKLSTCTSSNGPDTGSQCFDGNDAGVICTVPGYLGCYVDEDDRVLSDTRMNDGDMTIRKCIDFCQTRTMRYAGVQYSTECFCGVEGSNYDRLGRKDDSECDMTCEGNSDEICGGTWRMSIYDLTLGLSCEEPFLQNGIITGVDFSFGNWVRFTCESGYELSRDSALQCVLGNTPNESSWSGDIPSCQSMYVGLQHI